MKIVRPILTWGLALAAFSAVGFGQSLNIDLGDHDSPTDDYGAAAGQPGLWNLVYPGSSGRGAAQPLRDLTSKPLTGQIWQEGVSVWSGCPSALTGDDDRFLGDAALTLKGTQVWHLEGLLPGEYLVYSYAWPGCLAEPGRVSVTGSEEGSVCCGRFGEAVWPGRHVIGLTFALHRVVASEGAIEIQLETGDASAGARMCGFQLVYLNRQAGPLEASLVRAIPGVSKGRADMLVVRRDEGAQSFVVSGLAPQATALACSSPALQGALPFPARSQGVRLGVAPAGGTRRATWGKLQAQHASSLAGQTWSMTWCGAESGEWLASRNMPVVLNR